MAETVKKTTQSKPRKAAAKKPTASVESIDRTNGSRTNGSDPSHDQIADLARKYWAERGYKDGHQEEDWLRAEQELRGKAS